MSVRFAPFPDWEALSSQEIRAAVSPVGVYSSIPGTPTFPLITVKRQGGNPPEKHHLDGARMYIEVWGGTKSEARDLADTARIALMEMEGQTYTVGDGDVVDAFVTEVDDAVGLQWLPDPKTGRDRYFFMVMIFGHA